MTREMAFELNKALFNKLNEIYGPNRYTSNELFFEESFDALQITNCGRGHGILPLAPFRGQRMVIRKFAGDWIQNSMQNSCMLNFASAKYPGGGVTYGSIAQEEDICRNTLLYFYIREYWQSHYRTNAFAGDDYLLKNFIIYSKDVPTVKSDLSLGHTNDYITSAAPDLRLVSDDMSLKELQAVWVYRIKAVLAAAALNGAKNLVLGPWGCGVFRNDPNFVYFCFEQLLEKYGGAFDRITFLAPDEPSWQIFKKFVEPTKNVH